MRLKANTVAPTSPAPTLGDRLFAVSGLGSLGGSAVQGVVTDVSADGVEHTAPVGQAYQGGPLVNSDGLVVAISSRSYQPLNFASDADNTQRAEIKIMQSMLEKNSSEEKR